MIDWLVNIVTNVSFNSTMAICLYWVPMIICLVGYLFDFVKDYQTDAKNYQESYYDPKLTIGSILGRLIVSVMPVLNLGMALFKHMGNIIKKILLVCEKALNIPIIRHNPKPKQ